MKLDALREAIRGKQLLVVAVLASILLVVAAGFSVGLLDDDPDQDRLQQTNKLLVVDATAHVTENSTVEYVNLTVRRGTRDVNLSTTTIEWLGPRVAGNLVYADGTTGKTESGAVPPGDGRQFSVVSLRDEDESAPVVNDQTDRFTLVMNVTAVSGQRLAPGETVEVKLITSHRAVTRYTITIPESLDDRTTVSV